MSVNTAFLRTRVGRRILGLFIACAVVPVGVVAVISYRSVAGQLDTQSRKRIQQATRDNREAVLERLDFLDTRLRVVASAFPNLPGTLDERFTGLAMELTGGRIVRHLGHVSDLPSLSGDQERHLSGGRSVLATSGSRGEPAILMGAAIDAGDLARGILWAEISPTYLWRLSADEASSSDGMYLCVFDASSRPLYCSLPAAAAVALEQLASELTGADHGSLDWSEERDEYVAEYRSIFMRSVYSAASWMVVVSESKASVLEPLTKFQQPFLFGILGALFFVGLLSNIQIRRSMEPLVKLGEGTRRIAQRDFSTPVQVTSGDEFEDLATSFNSMASRLKRQFSALTAINEIDRAVLSALDTERIIDTVLSRTSDVLACDGMTMSLSPGNDTTAAWKLVALDAATSEKVARDIRPTREELQELRDHPLHLLIIGNQRSRSYVDVSSFAARGISSFLALPIFLKRELSGVIALGYAQPPEHDEEDLVQARQLADQVAVALSNTRLIEELDQLNWGALTALARTIDAKSSWTAGHSERVTALSLLIGRELRLPPEELEVLHRGGLLHDIGKIGVPAEILDKPARLTDEEREIMREHCETGARILTPIAAYAPMIPIVLHHHERFDGTGYPYGLAGEEIPFLARLLTVPDVYDALNSDRPYRPGWSRAKAANYILQHAGTHFDPDIANAFAAVHGRTLASVAGRDGSGHPGGQQLGRMIDSQH